MCEMHMGSCGGWRIKEDSQELVLSFYHMAPRVWTQTTGLVASSLIKWDILPDPPPQKKNQWFLWWVHVFCIYVYLQARIWYWVSFIAFCFIFRNTTARLAEICLSLQDLSVSHLSLASQLQCMPSFCMDARVPNSGPHPGGLPLYWLSQYLLPQ